MDKDKKHPFILLPVKMPVWARWHAIDGYGVLMAFETKPLLGQYGHWFCRCGRKKDILQYDSQSFRGWRKTLRRIQANKS